MFEALGQNLAETIQANLWRTPLAAFAGGLLLVAYSMGHCGLVLAGGTSMELVQSMADSKGWNQSIDFSRKCAGGLIVFVGFVFLLA